MASLKKLLQVSCNWHTVENVTLISITERFFCERFIISGTNIPKTFHTHVEGSERFLRENNLLYKLHFSQQSASFKLIVEGIGWLNFQMVCKEYTSKDLKYWYIHTICNLPTHFPTGSQTCYF